MPGISLVDTDTCGGTIRALQTKFTVRGKPAVVIGCPVDPHDPCWVPSPAHCNAVMNSGVNRFTIQGITVCVAGST